MDVTEQLKSFEAEKWWDKSFINKNNSTKNMDGESNLIQARMHAGSMEKNRGDNEVSN